MKISLSLLFILTLASPIKAETLIFKADRWCPFNCEPTSSQSKEMGYIIEVAKIVFERKGHNIDYQVDTWSHSIESVRSGKATAIVATTMPDAPDFIYPTKSMGSNKECFYVKKKDPWEFLKIENLKNRKLGIVESYAYSAELMSYLLEHPDQTVKSKGETPLMMNLDNMKQNKIDTIIENPFVFNYTTESKKIRDQYEEAGCTNGDPLYIGFSPKNPRSKEFAKILADGIEDLRKDGTLDKIITKYSLKDWSP
ncbi:MAG: transporter substrate-binding domain-containing protein [Rhizobacter sp.]|nr:transporter substrate-binding domain-containing protein [Bacteriovorax sp.]